jgi:hypothetical protein
MAWWLTDGRDMRTPINTSAELTEKLATLNNGGSENPVLALEHSAGHYMYVGLAGSTGFLNYYTHDDSSFVSVSDHPLQFDQQSVWFSYAGSGSEIRLRNCLPMDKVHQGVLEYYETGLRPACIVWEAD